MRPFALLAGALFLSMTGCTPKTGPATASTDGAPRDAESTPPAAANTANAPPHATEGPSSVAAAPDAQAPGPNEITQDDALRIAKNAAGGTLGTWINASFGGGRWYVTAVSKSLKAPVVYVIDARTRAVLLGFKDSNDAEIEGTAKDSAIGALLVMKGVPILMAGMEVWPPAVKDRTTKARGALQRQSPAVEVDGNLVVLRMTPK
jgi:hypothetical protein